MPVLNDKHTSAIGNKYGRLTVLSISYKRYMPFAQCVCECGTEKAVRIYKLYSGHTSSCGCLLREVSGNRFRTHGLKRHPAYGSWQAMIQRCVNPNNQDYADYGGRGIAVCDRWRESFVAFLEDMGDRPPKHEIDRIDNNGDYEPGNCRWATRTQQNRNSRHNNNITYNGRTQTITEWSIEMGLSRGCIRRRLACGWSIERALSSPSNWWNRRGSQK